MLELGDDVRRFISYLMESEEWKEWRKERKIEGMGKKKKKTHEEKKNGKNNEEEERRRLNRC